MKPAHIIPLLLITIGCSSSYEEMAKNEILRNASKPELISFGRFGISSGEPEKMACIEVEAKNGNQRFVKTGTALLTYDKTKRKMNYGLTDDNMKFDDCKTLISQMR